MELKVWVEGIQRIVCGVTEATTCQDVVFALAHATGKSGRFTLIERWRNNERQLSPNENPMKIIMKWGEYSSDVQFILQWNESNKSGHNPKPRSSNSNTPSHMSSHFNSESPERLRDVHKSLTFSGSHIPASDNIGVVKGVPQIKPASLEVRESYSNSPHNSPKKSSYCGSDLSDSPSHRIAPPYKDPPAPPPYRDPPPPTSSVYHDKFKKSLVQDSNKTLKEKEENRNKLQENVMYNAQYRELIALINYQREKLSNQQADLTKVDAEIVFLEGKEREKQLQLDFIAQELLTISNASKNNLEQVPSVYGLDTTDVSQWNENVTKIAEQIVESYISNTKCDHKPLPKKSVNSVPNSEDHTFTCEVCDRVFVGEFQWAVHKKSNRHKRRLESKHRKIKGS